MAVIDNKFIIEGNTIHISNTTTPATGKSGIIIKNAALYEAYISDNTVIAYSTSAVSGMYGIYEDGTGWGAVADSVKYGVNNIYGFAVSILPTGSLTREVVITDALKTDVKANTATGVHITGDLTVSGTAYIPSIDSPKNYISGFQFSVNTAGNKDLTITAGQCTDSTNAVTMRRASSLTKYIINAGRTAVVAWSVGVPAGGVPAGVTIGAKWIHVFIIMHANGTVDAGVDTSLTATNLLAATSYTYYRRIGSVYITGAAATYRIMEMVQFGDLFLLGNGNDYVLKSYTGSQLTNGAEVVLDNVPQDVITLAKIKCSFDGPDFTYALVSELSMTDIVPTSTISNLKVQYNNVPEEKIIDIPTSISSGAKVRIKGSYSGGTLNMVVLGYTDLRGKEGF
jgi:hypothetical protein